MKFETTPYALTWALKQAAKVCAAKSTVPAMTCARIRTAGDAQARIEATDLQTYISCAVNANVREDGAALAPAAALAKTGERMPREDEDGDAALMDVRDGAAKTGAFHGVTMSAAGSEAQIAGFPPEDFPALPEPDEDATRQRASRVSAGTVLSYLAARDGSTDVSYIVRDLFAGHRDAEKSCRQMLVRLANRGYIAIDWADGRMVRAPLRRYPEKEA